MVKGASATEDTMVAVLRQGETKAVRFVSKAKVLEAIEGLKFPEHLYKAGSAEMEAALKAFKNKQNWLREAVKNGKFTIKSLSEEARKEGNKAARKFRKALEKEYAGDPKTLAELKKMDIDHMVDLQAGGATGLQKGENLVALDRGVNRSVGSQLQHRLSKLEQQAAEVIVDAAPAGVDKSVLLSWKEGGMRAAKTALRSKQERGDILTPQEQHLAKASSVLDLDAKTLGLSDASAFRLLGLQKDAADALTSSVAAPIMREVDAEEALLDKVKKRLADKGVVVAKDVSSINELHEKLNENERKMMDASMKEEAELKREWEDAKRAADEHTKKQQEEQKEDEKAFSMEQQISNDQSALESLQREMAEVDSQISQLQNQKQEYERSAQADEQKASAYEDAANKLESLVRKLEGATSEEAKKELMKLQSELSRYRSEARRMRGSAENHRNKVTNGQIESLQARSKTLGSSAQQLRNSISQKKADASSARATSKSTK